LGKGSPPKLLMKNAGQNRLRTIPVATHRKISAGVKHMATRTTDEAQTQHSHAFDLMHTHGSSL
jgi:hypothetical protein